MFDSIPGLVFPFLVTAAAVSDVHNYKIPNWLTGLMALAFLPTAIWTGMAWQLIGLHYLAGFVLIFIGFWLHKLGVLGGGDAKMIAACAVWFGFQDTGAFLSAAVFCGGGIAVAMLAWTLAKYIIQLDLGDFIPSIRKVMPQIPYGTALAAGAIIAMPESDWLIKLVQMS